MLIRPRPSPVPSPIPAPKAVSTRGTATAGTLAAQRTVIHRERDGSTTPVHEKTAVSTVSPIGPSGGSVGITLGYKLPGPDRSYKSATVAVTCHLPHDGSEAGAVAAFEKAAALVKQRLEKEAAELISILSQ